MGFRASAFGALAVFLSIAPLLVASAASACSSDAFPIDKTTLTVQICEADARGAEGALQETMSVPDRAPLVRPLAYRRTQGGTARTIDDVALGPLGIAKTLHVTIAVRGGTVRLEHALLIPGAIPLK